MDGESTKPAGGEQGLTREELVALLLKQQEEMKKQQEELNKQQEELKKQQEVIYEISVKKLLHGGLPDVMVNPSCAPSIISNDEAWRRTLLRRRGEGPHLKCHDVADIQKYLIDSSLLDFPPNTVYENGEWILSELSLKFLHNKKQKLAHFNETSPQDYVSILLGDVLRCSGIEAQVVKEASVFSLRPDLVVVKYLGRILLAVEIKNPGTKGKEKLSTFSALETAGQIFDYLKGLEQHGNDSPIVVLSNYREMVICCLPKDRDQVVKLMQHARKQSTRVARINSLSFPGKPKSSPEKPNAFFISLPRIDRLNSTVEMPVPEEEQDAAEDTTSGPFDYRGRVVMYSQVFTLDKAFQALTLVVEAATLSVQESSFDFHIPPHNSSIEKELCVLGKSCFLGWKKFNVTIRYDKRPMLGQNFSVGILANIGRGSTGKCLLCCTTTGITFVTKLFLPKMSYLYSADERRNEVEESLKAKREEATTECRLWTLLLKQYEKFCFVSELNSIPALIMPYFAPLRKVERRKFLPQVETLLGKYAESGYTYLDLDVRWSHVGRRGTGSEEGDLVLVDLGSLSHVGRDQAKENVADVVQSLKERMEEDVQLPTAPPFVSIKGW